MRAAAAAQPTCGVDGGRAAEPLDDAPEGYCESSPAWPSARYPYFYKSFGSCKDPFGRSGTFITLYERVGLVEGYVDGATRTELVGWVRDPDGPTVVHVYARPPGASDFAFVGTTNQTVPRPDVGGTYGWNFGHTFAPGTTVRVYGIGVRPNGQPNDGRNPQLRLSSGSRPLDIAIP